VPLYEYQCQACGKVEEVRQKIADPAPAACKACSAGPMVKLLSQTSFILKGGGWYVTDFRGGAKPANADAPAATEKSTPAAEKPAAPAPKEKTPSSE
jgi:putative FmdB family regulatory protein